MGTETKLERGERVYLRRPSPPDEDELHALISSSRTLHRPWVYPPTHLLKGASPVTRQRQAELEIKLVLEEHLTDTEGALKVVLKRRIRDNDILLAEGYEQPLGVLAQVTERILSSEGCLQSFVDQAPPSCRKGRTGTDDSATIRGPATLSSTALGAQGARRAGGDAR
jgi:hypothetical protein